MRRKSIPQASFYLCSDVSVSLRPFAMSELSAYFCISVLLIFSEDGLTKRAVGGWAAAEQTSSNVNAVEQLQQSQNQVQKTSFSTSASTFSLKVEVKDIASRQYLSQASVKVFVNYTRTSSVRTEENGAVFLKVPYVLGSALTIVASMDGYILTPLPWKTSRMPIFSSITLSLFPQNKGNLWFFEDSILISGKISDTLFQPSVQFPKNLLKLPDGSNISSVTAYLTVPRMHPENYCFLCAEGLLINKSGFRSVGLSPVAEVSAQLFSNGRELQVTGPVQITLPLPESSRLRASDAVPAWGFDMKTGAWLNRGLGIVKKEESGLVWTYVAPHLGYWMAAPFPSAGGYMGHATALDFISYHTYLLMAISGGTLVMVVGFLAVLLCYCRGGGSEPEKKRTNATKMSALKKDKTTSTNCQEGRDASVGPQRDDWMAAHETSRHKGNFNIYVEETGRPPAKLYENIGSKVPECTRPPQPPLYVNSSEVVRPKDASEQNRVLLGLNENLFFPERLVHIYNQPVAILQAPELFCSPERAAGSKSATLPRKGPHGCDSQPGSKDGFTQTLLKAPVLSSHQAKTGEEQRVLEGPQGSASNPGTWGRYSTLLESVSVPDTLNEAAGMGPVCGELQGFSERALLELSKSTTSPHPRAWFVSLEGKPVAQVRHSIIDLPKKGRPMGRGGGGSNDASLDSGVDLSEPRAARRPEREKTFVRSVAHGKALHAEDLDLSSSESGTTAACTPEDPALRNILDSGSGSVPDIPEERDGADTSSAQEESESRSTPPPRRLRKLRDRSKVDNQKNTWHLREERPLMKLN